MIDASQLVINAAYALVGLSVYVFAYMLFKEEENRAAQESLDDSRNRKTTNPLLKLTRPFFGQYVVPSVRSRKSWDEKRKIYKRKIISAGLREELTPDEFIAFKMVLIAVFPLIGGLLNALDLIEIDLFTITGAAIGGWFYPDLWVHSRIKRRHQDIIRALPFIVDLLALSTEAGLDFIGAIQRVVEKARPSPLVDELGQLLKEIKVGSSRGEALRELAYRVNMQEVNSFVAILISADQMGASIGKVLRQQSEQVRAERMLRAEKAGAAAAQKLMFPIMFIMVPAVFLMIGAPFLLGILYPE